MNRTKIAAALLCLSLPVSAQAMEFQTPGTLGMGRAGVARTTDAYATFINPAGLAFYDKAFSMRLGAGAGLAVSSSLADNLDKVDKLDLNTNNMTYAAGASASEVAAATVKAAQFAGILKELDEKKGNLGVNVDLLLGFQYRNYGLGINVMSEVGAGIGAVDLINIRAGNATAPTTVSQLATQIGAGPSTGVATYFSQADYNNIVTALVNTGTGTLAQAQSLVSKLETELKSSGGNTTGLTPAQIAQGLQVIAPSLSNSASAGASIDNNTTKVLLRGIAIAEIPLAYGYKFELGKFGKLGIGGAAKIMQGTVYSSDVEVMQLKDSSDTIDKVKDNHTESIQFGLDLGALWRMEDVQFIGPVNVGLALKNLNTPKFDGPVGYDKIKVEPQARFGVALDPLSWLSIAADMDLTKNKTVIPGRESQLIGGGLEVHFDYWYALYLALRAGAYKNIGETGSKPVITAGLSLGPKWLRLDVNGAVATEKGTYDNKSVPLEGKVEFGLSTMF